MNRTSHPLFFIGKVAYYIGLLLLFNFFFGLLFFKFFVWIIAGAVLLGLLIGAMMIGKTMIFGTKNHSPRNPGNGYSSDGQSSRVREEIIDVEAEVFDDPN